MDRAIGEATERGRVCGRRTTLGVAMTGALLLLTVAASVLYVRSYARCDAVALFTPGGKAQVAVVHRGSVLVVLTGVPFEGRGLSAEAISAGPDDFARVRGALDACATTHHDRFGFGYAVGNFSPTGDWHFVAVQAPAWLVFAPLALLSVRRLAVPLRRRQRRRGGRCPGCGYDLRGSAGRCPECGEAPRSHLELSSETRP